MHRKKTKELIQRLAVKYNLPPYRVEEIVRSEFEFVRKTIGDHNAIEGDFKNIMLINFGKFYIRPEKVYKIKEQFKKRLEKENDTTGHEVLRESDRMLGGPEDDLSAPFKASDRDTTED
jgi:nucleoid DNA-binding protein